MRVIELLNKIANGEEVPNKILYNNVIWKYTTKDNDYISEIDNELLFNDDIDNNWIYTHLNHEIKVIEEQKKIEKLNGILEFRQDGNHISKLPNNEELMFKINEIIDYINKGETK